MGDGVRHRTPVIKAAGSPVDHARWVAYRGAEVCGVRMRGLPAWLTHRTCHLLKLPTLNRRLRVVSDRTLALLFRREVVSSTCSSLRVRTSLPRCAPGAAGRLLPGRIQDHQQKGAGRYADHR